MLEVKFLLSNPNTKSNKESGSPSYGHKLNLSIETEGTKIFNCLVKLKVCTSRLAIKEDIDDLNARTRHLLDRKDGGITKKDRKNNVSCCM